MASEDDQDDDKTEDATPRRRQEAREQGQVAISAEIVAATMLCAGLGTLLVSGGLLAQNCAGLVVRSLETLGTRALTPLDAVAGAGLITGSLADVALTLCVVIVPLWLVALLSGYLQVGFQVSPKAVKIDWAKLDPSKGLKRLISLRSSVRTCMALLKVLVIVAVISLTAWWQVPRIAGVAGNDLGPLLVAMGGVALRCTAAALAAILAIAAADWFFQRWQHERDLRMSHRDLRDEHKATEGDPHLRARIRSIQRELAQRRMMSDVPEATVVVTNPTHYAVALRYDREEAGQQRRAPYVVAKGVDEVAQRIKAVAGEAGVPLHENVALARALHAQCEIGDEIPEALYQAVASVLAYVYRVQGEAARA